MADAVVSQPKVDQLDNSPSSPPYPGGPESTHGDLSTRGLSLIYWEELPTWQRHWWSRERRDVPTRLASPMLTPVAPVVEKKEESEPESDSSSSSESEDDFDDPLAAPSSSASKKKVGFPVDTKLNEKITLLYVLRRLLALIPCIIWTKLPNCLSTAWANPMLERVKIFVTFNNLFDPPHAL